MSDDCDREISHTDLTDELPPGGDNPIAEPAEPGEPIDSIVMIAGDDGRSQQYDGDGRVHQHEEWVAVCVQASPAAVGFFETCTREIVFSSDALCLALADGTVVVSGIVASVGQQVETLYIAVGAPENDGGAPDA